MIHQNCFMPSTTVKFTTSWRSGFQSIVALLFGLKQQMMHQGQGTVGFVDQFGVEMFCQPWNLFSSFMLRMLNKHIPFRIQNIPLFWIPNNCGFSVSICSFFEYYCDGCLVNVREQLQPSYRPNLLILESYHGHT